MNNEAAVMPVAAVPSEIVKIAVICHEANRVYCATIGDLSQPKWEDAPEWQKKSAIAGVELHVAGLKQGHMLSPSASHEAWLEEKRRDGWTWGAVKDPEKKLHPCFIDFEHLPVEQRAKDFLFAAIVESLYKSCAFASSRD